jgi:hypothetical protein
MTGRAEERLQSTMLGNTSIMFVHHGIERLDDFTAEWMKRNALLPKIESMMKDYHESKIALWPKMLCAVGPPRENRTIGPTAVYCLTQKMNEANAFALSAAAYPQARLRAARRVQRCWRQWRACTSTRLGALAAFRAYRKRKHDQVSSLSFE